MSPYTKSLEQKSKMPQQIKKTGRRINGGSYWFWSVAHWDLISHTYLTAQKRKERGKVWRANLEGWHWKAMFTKWGGQRLRHNRLFNILHFLIVPCVAISLMLWWSLTRCSKLLEQFLTWFWLMPIPLWQFLSAGVEPGQELVPVDTVEKPALFWKLSWTIWTETLHAVGPGSSEWSWEH